MTPDGITDFNGSYEDYLRSQGVGAAEPPRRVSR
jgi:hypothetical protein